MPELSPLRPSLITPDRRWQVEFYWRGDRFGHLILFDNAVVAASVEGISDHVWPSSPPVQQLSRERINDVDVLLGVGAAGQSHWSISVEVDSAVPTPVIKFDVACRCKGESPQSLRSTYRLQPRTDIVPLQGCEVRSDETASGVAWAMMSHSNSSGTIRWSYSLTTRQTQASHFS